MIAYRAYRKKYNIAISPANEWKTHADRALSVIIECDRESGILFGVPII